MKALIIRPDGTRIQVEGTEEEIRRVVESLSRPPAPVTIPAPDLQLWPPAPLPTWKR